MLKRKLAIGMAIVLAAGSLFGCGGSGGGGADGGGSNGGGAPAANAGAESTAGGAGGSQDIVLRFSWWGNQVRNEKTDKVLKMYSEENPGVTFQEEINEFSSYWDRLAAQSAGNDLPDIIQMDYRYIDQYVSNGLLLDLTPYVESGQLDLSNIAEPTIESGTIGDGLYGICNGLNAPMTVYNKTITDQAGIEIGDELTMEQYIQYSKEIYEKTGVQTNIAYGTGTKYLQYFMRDKGETLFDNKGGLGGQESTFAEFFRLYENAINEGWHTDPAAFVEISTTSIEEDAIHSGKSWSTLIWSNQYTAAMNSKPEGAEYAVCTWPADQIKAANFTKPSQFFCVSSNSKNPEEAVKVINYLTNSQECNDVLLGERGVPASTVIADSITPKLSQDEQLVISFVTMVSENCSALDPADPVGAGEITNLVDSLVEEVCYGSKTAEAAAAEFYQKGNAILQKGYSGQ